MYWSVNNFDTAKFRQNFKPLHSVLMWTRRQNASNFFLSYTKYFLKSSCCEVFQNRLFSFSWYSVINIIFSFFFSFVYCWLALCHRSAYNFPLLCDCSIYMQSRTTKLFQLVYFGVFDFSDGTRNAVKSKERIIFFFII